MSQTNREIFSKHSEQAGDRDEAKGVGTRKHLAIEHDDFVRSAGDFEGLHLHVPHQLAAILLPHRILQRHLHVLTTVALLGDDNVHDSVARVGSRPRKDSNQDM